MALVINSAARPYESSRERDNEGGEREVERGRERADPEEREWRGRKDEKRKDEMREVERES